jgi:hypothetical protein
MNNETSRFIEWEFLSTMPTIATRGRLTELAWAWFAGDQCAH